MAVCTKHSDEETWLACAACDRPFCFRCLIQGPVGSKCRDCSRGIAIDAGRKDRAKAAVQHSNRDRSLSLKVLVGLLLVLNGAMFNRSGSVSGVVMGPTKYSVHAALIRDGESWRLFSGAIAGGSYFTVFLAAGATWWIGRTVLPRLGQLNFWAIVSLSLAGGVLALVFVRPKNDGYGILSLVGGLAATYVAGRRRSEVGILSMPFGGRLGYGIFFFGWILFGAVSSDPSLLVAMAGGAVAAGSYAVWFFDRRRPSSSAAIGGAATVAVLLVSALVASATSASVNTQQRSAAEALVKSFGITDPTSAPSGWMTVSSWEERNDMGDYQSFRVRCFPNPEFKELSLGGPPLDPARPCGWLASNGSLLKVNEDVPPACADEAVLQWRTTVVGDFGGKDVQIDVSGSRDCASPLAGAVSDAFYGYG